MNIIIEHPSKYTFHGGLHNQLEHITYPLVFSFKIN